MLLLKYQIKCIKFEYYDLTFFKIQAAEWQARAEKFEEMCCSVIQMFARLSNSANRTILYDLYPYIWDIKSIISMVKSFVQWLGMYDWDCNTLPLLSISNNEFFMLIILRDSA